MTNDRAARAGRRSRPPEVEAPLLSVAEARLPGGCVLDMHTHSSERSLDSGVRAERLVARARERGLDGVCLTEHNALWSAEEARALAEQHEVAVIPGMEIGTDHGHVLVFGLDRFRPELVFVHRLRAIVQAEGGAMVWAHPMRQVDGVRPSWQMVPELFEALEVINGDHSDRVDGYYATLAEELGVGRTAGSDAHSVQAVGRVGTGFPQPVRDVETLVRMLKLRHCAPLDFRPGHHRLRRPDLAHEPPLDRAHEAGA